MDYAVVKLVHQSAVALSIAGSSSAAPRRSPARTGVRGRRAAKTLPHVVDTVLSRFPP
jgi:uncharacterized membrane protein SirB2